MQRHNLDQELDCARTEGPVRTLVIPPVSGNCSPVCKR